MSVIDIIFLGWCFSTHSVGFLTCLAWVPHLLFYRTMRVGLLLMKSKILKGIDGFHHHLSSQVQLEFLEFPSSYSTGWWEMVFLHEIHNIAHCALHRNRRYSFYLLMQVQPVFHGFPTAQSTGHGGSLTSSYEVQKSKRN